ncbi:glycosyltransferase family 4 protein [Pseudothauera nasutitermitis]|uniref:Glycosyltransferase family 4 protein n=1 Tax=Pseudothauera nasutitermitis TaxID=2565930 RepID=A0A4S4AUK8_9RHOO|nr:glycosyltransferase family 4 protein [Pseudothauera nasutitermitis]THF63649.1 glycosyltransferase family 4 protein [Pseudothauera nasutitermitis]
MKIALLCSGLGHVARGHEVFARGLFDLLRGEVDITLFKGGGEPAEREVVVANLPRRAACLERIHFTGSPHWAEAIREQERCRIEALTFAYAALRPLLEGGYDILHCLEREVCEVLYAHRHLFARVPRIVFSNGGAIPARSLPPCDHVQEHSAWNLRQSARGKAFLIPHGVDPQRFHPGVPAGDFRTRHGIPADAPVAISVGTLCYWHKRTDHVIREVAALPGWHLIAAGQENEDSPAIKALAERLMPGRAHFVTLAHEDLPQAYAAADVFVLGSLFETFGIAYIEALAMGLPVFCTRHPNQQAIVQEGVFLDMKQPGALTAALRDTPAARLDELRARGPQIVQRDYDLRVLRAQYLQHYRRIAATPAQLPAWTLRRRIAANLRNLLGRAGRVFGV